jgi:lipoprotein-releasing system permease protein
MLLASAIVTGFQMEIRNKLIGFGAHITISNYDDNLSDEPHPISKNQKFIPLLKNLSDIKHISTFATKSGIIKTKTDNEGVLLKGISSEYDWTFINQNLIKGKTFTVSDTGLSHNIVISKSLADKLEANVNDKLDIYFITRKDDSISVHTEQRTKRFTVSGIYETGFEAIDKVLILVDIRQIQKLNYWNENQIGGFEIQITDFKKLDKIKEAVNDIAGQGVGVQSVKEMGANANVFSWIELQDINAMIVIILMILVAGINMISALLILILERTNMIGILKALGATNASVQRIFLYNAAYLIGKGMLYGNIIGLGIGLLQQRFGIFKLDKTQYYVSVIPVHFDWLQVLLLNVGTLSACLLMLIIPSFIISRITPVKAIRFS